MTRLIISASPLNDRWSITRANRRDQADWPPSPDTLFSALVAAAASLGQACHPALYWLESLGNPTIEAVVDPPRSEGIVHFSPVADRTIWAQGARQARWHNSVGDASPVRWSWPVDTLEHLSSLQSIAREITYIGSSRGPVLADARIARTSPAAGAFVPDPGGRHRIRGLYAGRLDELEAAFQSGHRPRPTETVGYARRGEERLRSPWAQMIPLRRARGPRLDVRHSVPIAEAVRRALTQHLPDGAPGVLTGHGADDRPLGAEHMAIVPLPRVGDRYADGELMGVGLMLPQGCSDADYGQLVGALGRWLSAGGAVNLSGARWALEVAHDDQRRSLRADRYDGAGASWTSVTPVVCDRYPRRDYTLADVVSSMCRDVGLPAPCNVEAAPWSSWRGGAESKRHHLGGRSYLARRYITHLSVTWSRSVPGPILLGRGRYFGLGAMLPTMEAA